MGSVYLAWSIRECSKFHKTVLVVLAKNIPYLGAFTRHGADLTTRASHMVMQLVQFGTSMVFITTIIYGTAVILLADRYHIF
jgi:hypothetical protein